MSGNFTINVTQADILKRLAQNTQLSSTEIAVYGRLLPEEVESVLSGLEQMRLIASSVAPTGRIGGQRLVRLTETGWSVARALMKYAGALPLPEGSGVPLQSSNWFSAIASTSPDSSTPYVFVAPDKNEE